MKALFFKELKSYFTSLTGWLYAAFLLIFIGIYTMAYNLAYGYAQFEYVLDAMSFVFMVACPILTMRVFSEERRSKTDQLLYSLPMSMTQIVVAKFAALAAVMALPMLITCGYPILLSQFGTVSFRTAYAAIIEFYLMGLALASIGMFVSSITENQVASAVITLVIMLVLFFMSSLASYVSTDASSSLTAFIVLSVIIAAVVYVFSKNMTVSLITLIVLAGGLFIFDAISPSSFENLFPTFMEQLSIFDRFTPITEGVFDIKAIVYFLSVSAVFVFVTVQSLEKRRWN